MTAAPDGPTSRSFDPLRAIQRPDPFEQYRQVRDEGACVWIPGREVWVVSRYDDVRAALLDHKVFSSAHGIGYDRRSSPDMLSSDPPEHTRRRRSVYQHFLPRTLDRLQPRVEELVDELLDDVMTGTTVDLVATIAEPLPISVIVDMLGIPKSDRGEFRRWSDATNRMVGGGQDAVTAAADKAANTEMVAYIRAMLAYRGTLSDPPDDLLTVLAGLSASRALSMSEVITFCVLLLVAGNETTTKAIGNAVLALCSQPDGWRALGEDPELASPLVEELFRFDGPTHALARDAVVPAVIGDARISAGDRVMLILGSANRDERHFPEPDVVDVRRTRQDHVAFGSGIHFCLGAFLARMEMRTLARRAARRIRGVQIVGPVEWASTVLVRGPSRIDVDIVTR